MVDLTKIEERMERALADAHDELDELEAQLSDLKDEIERMEAFLGIDGTIVGKTNGDDQYVEDMND